MIHRYINIDYLLVDVSNIVGLSDLQIRCIIVFALHCPLVDIFSRAAKLFRQINIASQN